MPSFTLCTSTHLEVLLDELTALMAQEPLAPFVPEYIVVQTHGMERWLSFEIARSLGICAHTLFIRPNDLFNTVLGDIGDPQDRMDPSPFLPNTLPCVDSKKPVL